MEPIRNVVVAGALGSVGPYIVSALLESGSNVTALTHSVAGKSFPPQVRVVETDYSSQSLESALQDQDAVISALGHAALDKQIALIEAAEKAGVRRFVPSDFGLPRGATDVPGYTAILAKKHQVADLLKEKAEQNPRFTWSTFINGPFLDRALISFPEFGFDVKNRSATIFDSGNEPFTAMALSSIGTPVARMLKFPEVTKNRPIHISALVTTQNEILAVIEARTGMKWKKVNASTKDIERDAGVKLKDGDCKGAYLGFLVAQLFQDGARRGVGSNMDNDLLGVVPEKLESIIDVALSEA